MQPDSARPNWLGGDPVLALCPFGFFHFFLILAVFLPLPVPHCLPLSLAHTLRYTEYINKDFFLLLLLLELPSSSLLHLNSPLLSFFVRCFLSSFLSPLCLSALFRDRFCPMSHIVRVHFTALIHIFSVKKKKLLRSTPEPVLPLIW